jgi:arsenate reductase
MDGVEQVSDDRPVRGRTRVARIVFLCIQNAGRSQMAAAWMKRLAGDAVDVASGGSTPASAAHPAVIETMAEVGVDLAAALPRCWTDEDLASTELVVTMGCGDECPILPGVRYLDWPLADPARATTDEVRSIRDDIRGRVEALVAELNLAPAPGKPA